MAISQTFVCLYIHMPNPFGSIIPIDGCRLIDIHGLHLILMLNGVRRRHVYESEATMTFFDDSRPTF